MNAVVADPRPGSRPGLSRPGGAQRRRGGGAAWHTPDCVPIAYTLTFNGLTSFAPMIGPALALVAPGGSFGEDAFNVAFDDFVLEQDTSDAPVSVRMSGLLASDCYGGSVSVQTLAALENVAGDLCPDAGELSVTGSGGAMATVRYDDGQVQVTPAGGEPVVYPFCFDDELLMCQPQ